MWGGLAGSALVVGAAIGYLVRLPKIVLAGVMAFGSGVLLSALSFELMQEAYDQAGFVPCAVGFFGGSLLYSLANWWISKQGGKHRKRSSGEAQESAADGDSGTAIAIGALLDGIPESMAIGLTLLAGGGVSLPTVVAIFISNIPEGLSSSAGMRASGRSAKYVFSLWASIAVCSSIAAIIGYSVCGALSAPTQAAVTAVAAGGILSMLAETMMPEAYEGAHDYAGFITCAGFASAFALSMTSA